MRARSTRWLWTLPAVAVLLVLGILAMDLLGWRQGLTPASGVTFLDRTAQSGVRFLHVNGAAGKKLLPETMGSGVAVLDFDKDGRPDLLFVNSRQWPGQEIPGEALPTLALYHNRGD